MAYAISTKISCADSYGSSSNVKKIYSSQKYLMKQIAIRPNKKNKCVLGNRSENFR